MLNTQISFPAKRVFLTLTFDMYVGLLSENIDIDICNAGFGATVDIEKVQKRANELVITLKKLPYKLRLEHLHLVHTIKIIE